MKLPFTEASPGTSTIHTGMVTNADLIYCPTINAFIVKQKGANTVTGGAITVTGLQNLNRVLVDDPERQALGWHSIALSGTTQHYSYASNLYPQLNARRRELASTVENTEIDADI